MKKTVLTSFMYHFSYFSMIYAFSVILFIPAYAQIERKTFSNENIKCSYEVKNGMIDGKYVSYYKNGQKKAEGTFVHNTRIGKWCVWDSTGKLRNKRDYINPFEFKLITSDVLIKSTGHILSYNPAYKLVYNKDGYIDYFKIEEKM